jgi:hypothetical protein
MIEATHEPAVCGGYERRAVYFTDSDCVEYVREDGFVVYERVDEFLTLIFDDTKYNLVGFKLKGFKYVFDAHLKPLLQLNDSQFVELVSAIEAICSEHGDKLFANQGRARAYKAARRLAARDSVKLTSDFLPYRPAA